MKHNCRNLLRPTRCSREIEAAFARLPYRDRDGNQSASYVVDGRLTSGRNAEQSTGGFIKRTARCASSSRRCRGCNLNRFGGVRRVLQTPASSPQNTSGPGGSPGRSCIAGKVTLPSSSAHRVSAADHRVDMAAARHLPRQPATAPGAPAVVAAEHLGISSGAVDVRRCRRVDGHLESAAGRSLA